MIREAWDRFWWATDSAYNLAAARIVIAGHGLWILLSRDYSATSALPLVFWEGVSETTKWRFLLFPGRPGLELGIQVVATLALVLVLSGRHARVAAAIAAAALYHLAPLETVIWTPNPYERGLEITIVALVVLAVSPCTRVWSVGGGGSADPEPSQARVDRWPILLIQLFIAQIYLFSGYSKLFRVGLEWISAENLRRWLLFFDQQDQVRALTDLGPSIAASPTLSWLSAAAAVAFDLGFIAVLFWPRARRLLVPGAVAFHTGIVCVMGIAFLNAPQLLVFVNWDWLRERLGLSDVPSIAAPDGPRAGGDQGG